MLKGTIIGNLGSDPEMRYSQGGSPFLRFSVAAGYRVRDQSGAWVDKTEWVRCTVFGARAEALAQFLHKGTRVYVEGRLEARPWTAQDGSVRAGLELLANEVELMSPRPDDGQQRQPAATGAARGQDDGDDSDVPF
jgi:single-strand DNA-binding protein